MHRGSNGTLHDGAGPGAEPGLDLEVGIVDELVWLLGALPQSEAGRDVGAALDSIADLYVPSPDSADDSVTVVVAGVGYRMVPGDELVVGRRGEAVIDHPMVSRRHVVVTIDANGPGCRDLGSANGTWVMRGGERVTVDPAGCVLAIGDRVETIDGVELFHVAGAG